MVNDTGKGMSLCEYIDLLKTRPVPKKMSPEAHFWEVYENVGVGLTSEEFCYCIGLVEIPKKNCNG